MVPLVIEPDRAFYTDPVGIVDFQSLYPSVIIAYNLCYSTCVGKIQMISPDSKSRKFGVYKIPANIRTSLGFDATKELAQDEYDFILDSIIISPSLTCFVKPHIREGIYP